MKLKGEFISAIFEGFSKEQVNLKLFVFRLILKNWELTDIPGHDEKLTPDKNLILVS